MSEEKRDSGLESDSDTFETVIPITICLLSDEDFLENDEDDGGHGSSFALEQSHSDQRSLSHDSMACQNYVCQKCIEAELKQGDESTKANDEWDQYSTIKSQKQNSKDVSQNEFVEQKDLGASEATVPSLYFLCEKKIHFLRCSGQVSQAIREHLKDCKTVKHDFGGQCFSQEDAAASDSRTNEYYRLKPYKASNKSCSEYYSTFHNPVTSSVSSSAPNQTLKNIGRFPECQEEEIFTPPSAHQSNAPMLCNTRENQMVLKKRQQKGKKSIHL
uniref:Uncharacterized protein LOC117356549 isoform X2 n=1 Tax=Geotrypetes seraphini TaxID=260995 RepID=A0A6P8Q8C6_GEOSA|nr:uncharacterized protein LOC117356549 isoform X2 [Geotrypetes seraphini]